ncbi:MAG: hypothetical protein AAGG75_25515 [Bacteroidota bacterium]
MSQNYRQKPVYTYEPKVTLEVGYEVEDLGTLPTAQLDEIEDAEYEIIDSSAKRPRPAKRNPVVEDRALIILGDCSMAVLHFIMSLLVGILSLSVSIVSGFFQFIFLSGPPTDNGHRSRRTIVEEETTIYHHKKTTYHES